MVAPLKKIHQHTFSYLKDISKNKISKKYIRYAYMFTQGFLYQRPALFQVSLSIFWKQSCKTALLQESSGIVLFGKSWLLPTIRNSEEFWFIYKGGKIYTSDLTSFGHFLNTCMHTFTSFPILSSHFLFPCFLYYSTVKEHASVIITKILY